MLGVRNISLNFENHSQTRDSSLKLLWESEEFLDVTVACDDDQVHAHKVILSAASPFFRQIFLRNPHNHPLIYLRGTSKKHFQSLLNFIYSGETSVNQDDLETFMALANNLKIHGLAGEFSETEEEGKEPVQTEVRKTDDAANDMDMIDYERKTIFDKHEEDQSKIEGITYNDTSDILHVNVEENSKREYRMLNEDEFEKRVCELMMKIESGWMCKECPYRSKNKIHVQEHVEMHIEGFSVQCKYCEKTLKSTASIRFHVRRFHKQAGAEVGQAKLKLGLGFTSTLFCTE